MAGVWDNTRRADVTNKAIPGFVKELPYTAWGKAKWDGYDQFMQTNGDYVGNCLPFGMSRSIYGPHPAANHPRQRSPGDAVRAELDVPHRPHRRARLHQGPAGRRGSENPSGDGTATRWWSRP